jgi:hypothetical protein
MREAQNLPAWHVLCPWAVGCLVILSGRTSFCIPAPGYRLLATRARQIAAKMGAAGMALAAEMAWTRRPRRARLAWRPEGGDPNRDKPAIIPLA